MSRSGFTLAALKLCRHGHQLADDSYLAEWHRTNNELVVVEVTIYFIYSMQTILTMPLALYPFWNYFVFAF